MSGTSTVYIVSGDGHRAAVGRSAGAPFSKMTYFVRITHGTSLLILLFSSCSECLQAASLMSAHTCLVSRITPDHALTDLTHSTVYHSEISPKSTAGHVPQAPGAQANDPSTHPSLTARFAHDMGMPHAPRHAYKQYARHAHGVWLWARGVLVCASHVSIGITEDRVWHTWCVS